MQISDLVLWENSFCSILDSLVNIAEPKPEKRSPFKSKLMEKAISIATGVNNMWAVEEKVFRDVSCSLTPEPGPY